MEQPLSFASLLAIVGIVAVILLKCDAFRRFVSRPSLKSTEFTGGTVTSAPIFFPASCPLWSLRVDNLDQHETRDHIYDNKAIRLPYYQTMAHQPMKPEHWVEVDKNYRHDLAFKKDVIEAQGKVVLDCLPEVEHACSELMTHLAEFLPARYPNLFERLPLSVLENKVTGERLELMQNGPERTRYKRGTDALLVVSRLVQDDFLIGFPRGDGSWYCAGGLVAFPGFYLLSEKIGRSLHHAHAPVPQFNEKLLKSVERTLTRLSPDAPIERTSWELVDDEHDLFWAPMAGPLPTDTGAKPMTEKHVTGRREDAARTEDPAELILRLDHQTFVKMPESGAVFFGVHPMRRKLKDLERSPLLPALLLKVHGEGPPDLMKYKGAPSYEESVLPYLEATHARQREQGLIRGDERPQDFREYRTRV